MMWGSEKAVKFVYKNWKGEVSIRTVEPINIWYGHTEYHTEDQWLLYARDIDKNAERTFAMKDMLSPFFRD